MIHDQNLILTVDNYAFVSISDPGDIKIDILASTCANRMEPRISKDFSRYSKSIKKVSGHKIHSDTFFHSHGACADTGADGRKDDLDDHLHIVHIGFQIRDTFHIQVTSAGDWTLS